MSTANGKGVPAVIDIPITGERQGICPICHSKNKMQKTHHVYITVFNRKPDGTRYTEQEGQEAANDWKRRWDKGPFAHPACMTKVMDKLAGFDETTGEYGETPRDLDQIWALFSVGASADEEEGLPVTAVPPEGSHA